MYKKYLRSQRMFSFVSLPLSLKNIYSEILEHHPLNMKKSLHASGIIEAMVVLLLLTVWITWVYSILSSSQKLSNSTALRIEAIQIARDGLEAMTNIRNTNWIEFWGDIKNCWNTYNYNPACIGNTAEWNKITHTANEAFILYRDEWTWKFMLEARDHSWDNFSNPTYRNSFWVKVDSRWFYTQTWSTLLDRPFTREIRINYLNANNIAQGSSLPNNPKMEVTSSVQWADPALDWFRELEMKTILTNWKDRN